MGLFLTLKKNPPSVLLCKGESVPVKHLE